MRIYFVSLGCDKNLVDSEYMLGLLREAGHTLTEEESEAEAIVINTCCFIHDAKEESIETILEAASYKTMEVGCCRVLVVTGCLAERYRSEIAESIPEVDAILGTASFDEIVTVLKKAENGNGYIVRAFEALNKTTECILSFGQNPKAVYECDLLENKEQKLHCENAKLTVQFKPFEIKTFIIDF